MEKLTMPCRKISLKEKMTFIGRHLRETPLAELVNCWELLQGQTPELLRTGASRGEINLIMSLFEDELARRAPGRFKAWQGTMTEGFELGSPRSFFLEADNA